MSGVSLQRTGGANRRVGTRVKTRHPQSGEQWPGEPPEETAAQEELPWAQDSLYSFQFSALEILCGGRSRQAKGPSLTASQDPPVIRQLRCRGKLGLPLPAVQGRLIAAAPLTAGQRLRALELR
ncbi:hypothetical protein MG293_006050 [Ovis ammon polii]|uniref:Uncharacterized protein n=1 Tax=Ovis ammon polii TaxID=230172 RepID=A0AAD4UDU5_OVIAM|nr:hypothetical protein MG293_006050 [Ovis ammon polii]